MIMKHLNILNGRANAYQSLVFIYHVSFAFYKIMNEIFSKEVICIIFFNFDCGLYRFQLIIKRISFVD